METKDLFTITLIALCLFLATGYQKQITETQKLTEKDRNYNQQINDLKNNLENKNQTIRQQKNSLNKLESVKLSMPLMSRYQANNKEQFVLEVYNNYNTTITEININCRIEFEKSANNQENHTVNFNGLNIQPYSSIKLPAEKNIPTGTLSLAITQTKCEKENVEF